MLKLNKSLPIYVVDDDESVRDSLELLLAEYDFNVASFDDGRLFLSQASIHEPGCVILDSRMPELMGQEVHQILAEKNSPLSVIFLTGHGDVPMAVSALRLGAVHFFQKPVRAATMLPAIREALYQSEVNARLLAGKEALDSLTNRELGILRLLIAGKRNSSIADELCIAERTVEVHRASLMKKFSARTVAELAYVYGLVE
ncbi:response regulator transcription factor [Vibrio hangzhouensis]|uniref:Two component transcriptional regulator, LuxR family n=1 Tax=Vibrio hangzhouensis TaxID=462991 RepID=A0A1H6C5E8_9VIBR|nr:response regulator [Vibrio hangzhouensis]SEG67957.1 two component transcriptional regulator, LuxR family [Vibrio hangzhouensis]